MRLRVLRVALLLTVASSLPPMLFAQEADLAGELPRIKPLEPAAALRSFQVREGFHLEPLAVEPLVTDPVSVCYDAVGRLYVAEMRGYPYPESSPTGNVTRLEDNDGDGRFDRRTIFVDGLSWPTSVVPYADGVFIAVAPDILYARDVDGDGVADIKKVMFTGFGTQNVQALVNGLLWGPDGWIYGVSGGNGGEIRNLSRPGARPVSVRGRDFRFRPDGSAFEAISGGGQFGHAFDDWGHRFTCNNSNHIRQIVLPSEDLERNPALIVPTVLTDIAAEGPAGPVYRTSPAEPWRVVRTRQRMADPETANKLAPTERVATGFFTSATGVTIYRGTAYPPAFHGNAFVGDVGGNLVHRKVLSRNGAVFLAHRPESEEKREFLTSTDNWFRPVNFANTPDGTLLILDMYRETIEHPFSIPEPIKRHLDLTSGKDRGRLYNLVADGMPRRRKPALERAKVQELVKHLADRDGWWRETAQRLLVERGDPVAVAPLRELARSRPNALARVHALWTLDVLGALDDENLVGGFEDGEPGVREQAARLAKRRAPKSAAVRDRLFALAADPDAMVRLQVAFSLGEVSDPRALDALAAIAERDPGDRWIRAAVLSSLAGRTAPFLDELAKRPGFLNRPEGRIWLDELCVLVGAEGQPAEVQSVLARFAGPGARPGLAGPVVAALGRGLQRSGTSLREVLRGPAAARLEPLFQQAAETARSERSDGSRIEAIRLLALGTPDRALRVIPDLLDPRQPAPVQLAALQALAALDDRRVATVLLDRWKSLGPSMRREALEVLFARPERLGPLLGAIEASTIAPAEIDHARRARLLALPDRELRDRASRVLGTETKTDRTAVLTAFRPALGMSGDRDRGRAVFLKVCATCHQAEGRGQDVGPKLATVATRPPEDLLVHILDPNREVAPQYLNYTVATTDGRVLSGIIAEEAANSLTLKRAEGATDVVPRSLVEEVASTKLSLMPEGLEKGLTPSDFADLIAFVRGLAGGR